MLALRNLERGNIFKLPSGQEVATALGEEPIPDEDLVIGKATEKGEKTPLAQIAEGFAGRAPPWAYILSEAQVTSWKNAARGVPKNYIPIKLGPVGGRRRRRRPPRQDRDLTRLTAVPCSGTAVEPVPGQRWRSKSGSLPALAAAMTAEAPSSW